MNEIEFQMRQAKFSMRAVGASALFSIGLLFVSTNASAQETYSNYDERFDQSRSIAAINDVDSAFSAQISPGNGSLSFSIPVLSIPSDAGPPIEVVYRLGIRSIAQFTEWYFEEDRPYLYGSFSDSKGWVTYGGSNARCSGVGFGSAPPLAPSSGRPGWFYPYEYWYGYFLSMPSGGGRLNRIESPIVPAPPTDGANYQWVANGDWYFSCTPLIVGAGEGFVGRAPNGMMYFFNTMDSRPLPMLNKLHPTGYELELERSEVRLYAGKIEDRFGNYVTGLTASDGRVVTKTVSGNTTIYTYGSKQWSVTSTNPFTVTYPDGSTWTANVSGNLFTQTSLKDYCPGNPNYTIYPGSAVATVKSPSGATAVYTVQQRAIGYSYVPGLCADPMDGGGTKTPSILVLPAVVSRSVSGPGMSASSVAITYGSTNDCFSNPAYWYPSCNSSSPTTRLVTYNRSDGHFNKYTFGNRHMVNADLLLKLEEGQGSTVLRTTDFEYSLLDGVGSIVGEYPYGAAEVGRPVQISRKITQQGRIFRWAIPSVCGSGTALCIDQYGRPTKVERKSTP